MSKTTPGPWQVVGFFVGPHYCYAERIGPPDDSDLGLGTDSEDCCICGTEADLTLAAEAPNLLSACKLALIRFEDVQRADDYFDFALEIRALTAAIAKAEPQ